MLLEEGLGDDGSGVPELVLVIRLMFSVKRQDDSIRIPVQTLKSVASRGARGGGVVPGSLIHFNITSNNQKTGVNVAALVNTF